MYNKCYRELKTKKQKDSHLLNIKGKFDNILKDSINERFGLNVCLIGVSDKNCQTVVKFLNEDLLKEVLDQIEIDEKEKKRKAKEGKLVMKKKTKLKKVKENKKNKIFTDWDFLYLKDMCKLSHCSFTLLCNILHLETNLNRIRILTKKIHNCFKTKKQKKAFITGLPKK